jgi:hypothetical protein
MNPILFSIALAVTAHGAVLVDWNLDTVNYPTHPNAADNNATFAGVSSSVATVGANLSVTNLITASSGNSATQAGGGLVWSSGNPAGGELNLQRWDYVDSAPNSTTSSGDGTPNNWLRFTLSAQPGYQFTLTTIDLSAWRNGAAAPGNWRFDYWNGSAWVPFAAAQSQTNVGDFTFRAIDDSEVNPFPGTGDPETFLDTRGDTRFFYRLIRP